MNRDTKCMIGLFLTLLAFAATEGCDCSVSVSSKPMVDAKLASGTTNVYNAPVFDTATQKPSIPDVDPKTISPTNDGYTIDLDGDGVPDFVKMEDGVAGRTVYWTKGPVEQHQKVNVLSIKGSIMAYNVCVLGGDTLPSVLFWNSERKGFKQKCLGNNAQGIPYFGALEEQ